MIIWALCGRFCVLMSSHYWSRNGCSSWLCFYMYSAAKSALLCHLSFLHLSCTSAKNAFLGHWAALCSPVEESSCGAFKTTKQRRCLLDWSLSSTFRVRTYTNGKGLVQDFLGAKIFLLCNKFDFCLFQCTGSLLLLSFQIPYNYFSRQTTLTQWAQPYLHFPWSYHLSFLTKHSQTPASLFLAYQSFLPAWCLSNLSFLLYLTIRCLLIFKLCQKYVFFFFFFLTFKCFFLVHRHVLTQ